MTDPEQLDLPFARKKGEPPAHLREWTPEEQMNYLVQLQTAERLHQIYNARQEKDSG